MPYLTYRADPCHWLGQLRPLGYALLLDSANGHASSKSLNYGNSTHRYDIITAAPESVTIVQDGTTTVYDLNDGTARETCQPVFDELSAQMEAVAEDEAAQQAQLPFTGGLAGYWGYELNHQLEPECVPERKTPQADDTHHPEMIVGLYLWAIISDHQTRTSALYLHPDLAETKKQRILHALKGTESSGAVQPFSLSTPFRKMITADTYRQSFQRIQEWITAGDCYQINLTQRFTGSYQGDPWQAYQYLREISPTPFSAFLDFPQLKVLSLSPERLLLSDHGHIETKPIKGTRPRGLTPEQDQQSAEELLNSEKDRAENLMIVDLLRNDLGRNCQPGSIKVPVLFGLESYANVHHMVSTITGELAEGRSNLDLLRDAFPGGSVTGAPKIRAMQIIQEIEPYSRSVYCGSVGYISLNGRMDTNITIRTLVADGEEIHAWGGGAIVADSECDSEYEESLTKVRNLVNGLEEAFLSKERETA
ncbi:aminodeoxychorismate synthase component I [Parendozoicomonas haliclonae]|uniref:aminodeoxychorismate synthase component I n=1 Tax=Parendozoicomonas haliclonae TaxID=1960125 RepID=UPI001F60BC53|nr:aminodeoxychorismate synthase component I [Parendozoicomonas haliclonae]